jgi:uncharacterized membrane protein
MDMAQVMIILGAMLLVLCLGPLITMLGWHLFAVPVFGLKGLTFFQSFGLFILLGGARGISYTKK